MADANMDDASMADANVIQEAAKFLDQVGDEDKKDPKKLASKLYAICQYMKATGKESTLPYKIVTRALEMVVRQLVSATAQGPDASLVSAGNGNQPGGTASDEKYEASSTSAAQPLQGIQSNGAFEEKKEAAQPALG